MAVMNYKVVTCIDESILKENGLRLLEQFKNNWQPNIEFHCYYFNLDISNYSLPESNNIKYHSLDLNDDYKKFIEDNKTHDGTEGGTIPYATLLDVLSTVPKVFSISDCAFNHEGCWMIWIDPMSLSIKDIRSNTLGNYFPSEKIDFVSLDSQDYIMGFNLSRKTPVELIGDWLGAYISDEFLNYREWGSSFILNRLVTIYNSHGMRSHELDNIENLIVNLKDTDLQATKHSKERQFRHDEKISNRAIIQAVELSIGKVIQDYANGELANDEPFHIRMVGKGRTPPLNVIAVLNMQKGPDTIKVITVMRKDDFQTDNFAGGQQKTYTVQTR